MEGSRVEPVPSSRKAKHEKARTWKHPARTGMLSYTRGERVDILYKAAIEYRALTGKTFEVDFSNGESIQILFQTHQFAHLVGLKKFADLEICKLSANALYKMVLRGKLSNDDLKYSQHYSSDSRERIEGVCRIGEVFTCGNAVYGFDPRSCAVRSSLRSSILFFKDDGCNFFLTLGIADGGLYYYPETFFYRYDNAYIRGQNIVRVSDIRIIR